MASTTLSDEKRVEEQEHMGFKETKAPKWRSIIAIFAVVALLLFKAYPSVRVHIRSTCKHHHGELTVEERASKILSENPLIGMV